MAITIATWDNNKLTLISQEKKSDTPVIFSPSQKNSASISTAEKIALAIDEGVMIRRSHIKPFDSRRQLKKILPSFLTDKLFKTNANTPQHSLFVSDSLEKNKFNSFTLLDTYCTDILEKTSLQVGPVTRLIPQITGLSYYIPKNERGIVVWKNGENTSVAYFNKTHQLIDFRKLSNIRWQKEATLTLSTWLSLVPGTAIYTLGNPVIPQNFKTLAKEVELPKKINTSLAASYGLSQIGISDQFSFPVLDPMLAKRLTGFSSWGWKIIGVAGLATVIAVSTSGYNYWKTKKQYAAYEKAVESIFNESLPGVPMIDAPLQMTRRANELALAMGGGMVNKTPLSLELVALQEQLNASELNISLDELLMTDKNLTMRGLSGALSDVDEIQNILKEVFPHSTVKLINAQMGNNGRVEFQVEVNR